MIIDFHTHVFPDHLAARALAALTGTGTNPYKPVHDSTVSGLLETMDDWSIDASVVLPVVTKASQVSKTNEWAASICSDRIVSFGGIYPNSDDYKKDIDHAVELGLKGLKFHAEYQDFLVDDDRMLRVYDYALNKGLILLHHAGFDPDFLPPFNSSPRQFARVIKLLGIEGGGSGRGGGNASGGGGKNGSGRGGNAGQGVSGGNTSDEGGGNDGENSSGGGGGVNGYRNGGGVFIAAHLGGHDQWDDVEEYLVGTGIYLDTSMGFEYYPTEQFLRIVKNHGADKILFATDSPWSNAGAEIESLKALPLSDTEKALILGGNARRLLGR